MSLELNRKNLEKAITELSNTTDELNGILAKNYISIFSNVQFEYENFIYDIEELCGENDNLKNEIGDLKEELDKLHDYLMTIGEK